MFRIFCLWSSNARETIILEPNKLLQVENSLLGSSLVKPLVMAKMNISGKHF